MTRLLASISATLAVALLGATAASASETARFRVVSGSVVQKSTWESVSSNQVCTDRKVIWTDSGDTSIHLHLVGRPILTFTKGGAAPDGRLVFRGVQSRHSTYKISYEGVGSHCAAGFVGPIAPRTRRCGTRKITTKRLFLRTVGRIRLIGSFNAFGSGCASDSTLATTFVGPFWPANGDGDLLLDPRATEFEKEVDLYGSDRGQFDHYVVGPGFDQGPHSQDGESSWRLKLQRLRG